jgi:hypothetical protein
MSNFLGSAYINEPVQSSINLPLIQQVLAAKQGEYDANKAKLTSGLEQLSQLQVLRPQDKEYIQAKMQDITTKINTYGNSDLSQSFVADDMFGMIKSAARDPFILSAIENTSKLNKVNSEIAEKKKKGDGKYNDLNYQDMLKQAGYFEYMNGKTNDIGSLNYVDYQNVPKILMEETGKWAKDHGYTKMVDSTQGEYYIKQDTREVLTKKEILNYVQAIVDPSMKQQMAINTRATYGAMSDKDYNEYVEKRYKQENERDVDLIAEMKAKKATVSGTQADIYEKEISSLETTVSDRKKKIESKTFDRNEQYSFYQNDLYFDIADAYDRNTIVDTKYDTVLLDIKKYELDRDYKERDLLLKAEANRIAKGVKEDGANGTAIPVIPEDIEGEEKPEVDIVRESFVQTEAQLKAILSKEDLEYKKLTSLEQRNAYVRGLMSGNNKYDMNNPNPHSPRVLIAVQAHKGNYQAYSNYLNAVTVDLDKASVEDYNDMRGQKGLDKNNLASTMPYTANFLKANKKFEDLTKGQQDLIRYERAANQLQYDDDLGEKDREALLKYTKQLKTRNSTNKDFTEKVNKMSTEEVGGPLDTTGNVLGILGNKAAIGIGNAINELSYYPTKWIMGTDTANKNYADTEKDIKDMERWSKNAKSKVIDYVFDRFVPFQDTNITEVDREGDTKSGKDLASNYRNKVTSVNKEGNRILKEYLPNLPEKVSFSFSTTNKNQVSDATTLGQVVQKHGGGVPAKGENNYNLEYFTDKKAFIITYNDKDGKQQQTDFLNEKLIPSTIRDKYVVGALDWSTNVRNKFAKLPSFSIAPPKNHKEVLNMVNVLAEKTGQMFSGEQLQKIRESLVTTPEEKKENIYQNYPILENASTVKEGVQYSAKDDINKLVNSRIEVRSQLEQGSHFMLYPVIIYNENGKEVEKVLDRRSVTTDAAKILKYVTDFDPQTHIADQLEIAANAYDFELDKIVNKYTPKK